MSKGLDAIEELGRRLRPLGFKRKGARAFARPVDDGLQLVTFVSPGTREVVTPHVSTWLATLEARDTGRPVPWPRARFEVPEERRQHTSAGLAEIAGKPCTVWHVSARDCVEAGLREDQLADLVWSYWPQLDQWLREHSDVAWLGDHLAAEARARWDDPLWHDGRTFSLAGLCFLVQGRPEQALEMQRLQLDRLSHAAVVARCGGETVASWRAQAEAWWTRVLAGTPTPQPPRLRSAIMYGSTLAGERLSIRDLAAAEHHVASALRRFTTFDGWDEATMELGEPTSTAAHRALLDEMRRDWPSTDVALDRAALEAAGIAVDPLLAEALELGPCRLRRWCSRPGAGFEGDLYHYVWKRPSPVVADDLIAFCTRHRKVRYAYGERVQLRFSAGSTRVRDPDTGEELPFQGAEHYPPERWPCFVTANLDLHKCSVSITAKLPFETFDDACGAWCEAFGDALGCRLKGKNFWVRLVNAKGTGSYDRKLKPVGW